MCVAIPKSVGENGHAISLHLFRCVGSVYFYSNFTAHGAST